MSARIQSFIRLVGILTAAAFLPLYSLWADQVPDNIARKTDIVYASPDGIDQTLDIAWPREPTTPLPCVVEIHGGGWRRGSKSLKRAVGIAEQGYVGVSINYRLSDVALFPAAVHDCKAAIRWLRAHAAEYHIDPDRIGVRGSSAGGHLAALLGTSGGDPYLEGDEGNLEYSSRVQVVVDFFGPTDILRMQTLPSSMDHLAPDAPETQFFGRPVNTIPEVVELGNPIKYLDPTDPPVLIVHGERDEAVNIKLSELFFAALQEAGVKCRFVPVKNAGHGLKPTPPEARIEPRREEVNQIVREWLAAHLRHANHVAGDEK